MCGISGFIDGSANINLQENNYLINHLVSSLKHRGPDDNCVWTNNKNLWFGHNRLSINDLSQNGSQPMVSKNGRFVIIFNGEIYNFLDLKKKYFTDSFIFKSESDTEVLIEMISKHGINKTLDEIEGMFAFALFDKKNNNVFLVRDKFGEKPLYYGTVNQYLFFSSELKSFNKIKDLDLQISDDALAYYFKYRYINAPLTIYKNFYKLNPSTFLKININSGNFYSINPSQQKIYWDISKVISKNFSNKDINYAESEKNIEESLISSVKKKLISDVPLGTFLSGGIDSSLITSIASKISSKKINTFTLKSGDELYDESVNAKKISKYLGTEHNEITPDKHDMENLVVNLSSIYCEPFSDSSQLPTFIISEFAKTKVSVVLSGDGGDEFFGGYNRYIWNEYLWKRINKLPFNLRKLISKFLKNINPSNWDYFYYNMLPKLLKKNEISLFGNKMHKFANLILSNNIYSFYDNSRSSSLDNKFFTNINIKNYSYDLMLKNLDLKNINFYEMMMYWDTINYLPNDILTKVDRASMANSLETRHPFLDTSVYLNSLKINQNLKIKNGQGKIILRNILKKYISSDMIDKSKKGFSISIDNLIRNELKNMTLDILNSSNSYIFTLFEKKYILKLLSDHFKNKSNNGYEIWDLIMLENWHKTNYNTN